MNQEKIQVLVNYRLTESQIASLNEISDRLDIAYFPKTKFNDIPQDVLKKAEVLLVSRTIPEAEKVPNLRWIQYTMAGFGSISESALLAREGFRVTSLSGANAPIVAEFSVAAMLAAGHQFHAVRDDQGIRNGQRTIGIV